MKSLARQCLLNQVYLVFNLLVSECEKCNEKCLQNNLKFAFSSDFRADATAAQQLPFISTSAHQTDSHS